MNKTWHLKDIDSQKVDDLRAELKISKSLCEILVRREIYTYNQAKNFFRPEVEGLHDPYLMKDMDKAVARITQALKNHESICVYGDYDVDGTMSVSVLYDFLSHYVFSKDAVYYYIPDRNTEGYGLSYNGIDYARRNNMSLIIVTDCGIKDIEKVRYASEIGIDIIIIDHHIPGDQVPEACAILNPQQVDCSYPYKELSACGLSYKFVCALRQKLDIDLADPHQYLDWTTLSIASDIVPMQGENRILAFEGLKKINSKPSRAVQEFVNRLAIQNKNLKISDLVFKIGPKINASGRMTHASEVVKLFTATDSDTIDMQMNKLFQDNSERQSIDKSTTDEIFAVLDESLTDQQKSIVVYNPSWHKGILGIVASRIVERYYKPVVVLTESHGVVVGSARSVHGFDIYEALTRCRSELIQFGGHAFAAGMTLEADKITAFQDAFEQSVKNHLTEASLLPLIEIDAEITLEEINDKYVNILMQFEPCGPRNHNPIFLIRNLYDTGYSKTVKEIHAQLYLSHKPQDESRNRLKGIAFNMGDWIQYLKGKKPIDVVCHIERETWNGRAYNSLRVLDIRPSIQ